MLPALPKRQPRTVSTSSKQPTGQHKSQERYQRASEKVTEEESTVPRFTYQYQQVSWEVFMDNTYDGYKTVRASFIPYVTHNKEEYWLLGSFYDYPKDILTDFGGNCIIFDPPTKYLQPGDRQFRYYQHAFGCAVLELNEESKGLLVKPVLASLGTHEITVYRGTDDKRKEYVWFLMVPLDYTTIRLIIDKFEFTSQITDEKLGPLDLYRLSDIINRKFRTSRNLTDFVNFLRISQ